MKLRPLSVVWLLAALPAAGELQRFQPCPDSPNCVSSLAADKDHKIEPLQFDGDPAEAWMRLQAVVSGMKRAATITSTGDYLHVEVRSRLLRFVDDVEFQLDTEQGQIEMRSASRKGHSDLGVNRKRTEKIRRLFLDSVPPPAT